MKSQNSGFFWPSFADLMTSLFFIMLVLYVLTYLKLSNQQRVTEQQLKKITDIQTAVQALPKEYFRYDSTNKRYSLVQNIEFLRGRDEIQQGDVSYLVNVGKSIQSLISDLKSKYAKQDIKYVVIVEGMASRDNYADNYPLSYKRAWAVQKLWERYDVMPDQEICEVQIAGSGTGGIGRFPQYPNYEEVKNQRILIQIVPKIGKIE